MADKEYIAGDPSDVLNVFKTMQGILALNTRSRTIGRELESIHRRVLDSVKERGVHERALLLTNMKIEIEMSKIKAIEDARVRGLISNNSAQARLRESTHKMNTLLNAQAFYHGKINTAAARTAKTQKNQEVLMNSILGIQTGMFSSLQSILGVWLKTGNVLLGFVAIAAEVVKIFNFLDEAAFKFRQEMGFTRKYTEEIDNYAREGAINMAKMSVTGKEMYEATAAIGKELFTTMNITQTMVNTTALIAAQLGVSANTSVELMKNLGLVGKSTADAQKETYLFLTALSEAAGTPLKDVMADINQASKNSYQFISRSSTAMIKAAVDARRMGTSIADSTKTSSALLNFTQNVKDEMEASVLVGKSINLQKARELAYHRDIEGLNKEILNIMKEVNFEQLDPFQQDAVARALGKSASELGQMAQAERERANMVRAMTPAQREQYKTLEKMMAGGDKVKKDYAEIAKKQLEQMSNQTRLNAINASWNKIMMKLAEVFLPMIDVGLKFIADNFDDIAKGIAWFFIGMKKIVDVIVWAGGKVMTFGAWVLKIGNLRNWKWLQTVGKWVEAIGFRMGSFSFGKILTSLSKFAKFLLPLIFAINIIKEIKKLLSDKGLMGTQGFWAFNAKLIFRAIGAVIRAFITTMNDMLFGIPGKIMSGLKAAADSIFGALLDPFKRAWHWIKEIFVGKSPSQLGLAIVEGIVAVESMLINALLSPFKKAWELIKKIPFVSKLFGSKNMGAEIAPETKATMKVERPKPEVDVKKGGVMEDLSTMGDDLGKRIDAIVGAINALRDDMKNGSLTANVYIDSQKLDALMGRRLAYTGQLT
jgi:hypothetical protein